MFRIILLATILLGTTAYPRVPIVKDGGDSIFQVRSPNQVVEADWLNPSILQRAPASQDWTDTGSVALPLWSGWNLSMDPSLRSPTLGNSHCDTRTSVRYCR